MRPIHLVLALPPQPSPPSTYLLVGEEIEHGAPGVGAVVTRSLGVHSLEDVVDLNLRSQDRKKTGAGEGGTAQGEHDDGTRKQNRDKKRITTKVRDNTLHSNLRQTKLATNLVFLP